MPKWLSSLATALVCLAAGPATLAGELPEGLVVSGLSDGRWHVYRADGNGQLEALGIDGHVRSVAPGPAGERVAYVAADGSLRVHNRTEGTTRTRVTPSDGNAITDPTYTPDGDLLVVVLVDGDSRDTYIARTSEDGELLTYHDQSSAQFSPVAASDGHLTYVGTVCRSGCGGLLQTVWSYQPASGRANQLTRLNAVSRQPYPGANGGVYFVSDAAGPYNIWHAPAGGGRAVRVTASSARDASPVSTGDGTLYFLRHDEHGAHLMRRSPDESTAEPVALQRAFDNLKDLRLHPCTYSDCS